MTSTQRPEKISNVDLDTKMTRILRLLHAQQTQLDTIEQHLRKRQKCTPDCSVLYSAEELMPRPTYTDDNNKVKSTPICRPLVIETVMKCMLSDATITFVVFVICHHLHILDTRLSITTQQLVTDKRNNLKSKLTTASLSENYVQSALIYDLVRNMTKTEQLQHQLNERAKEHGVHLGRADGDWRANHFISKHFGNVADAIKSAKKKSEVCIQYPKPRVMSIEATAEMRMATAMMVLTVTLQSILTTMLETTIMEGQVFLLRLSHQGSQENESNKSSNHQRN
ncbi:hypothetical protein BCR42DRAFT_444420 [Absidia repens]|uniref:Uncharacterized protein n=1 Tax=Absidia repens TaxID=90262 RepID=A0A1X2HR65_9FUNG|nr:hypothetical protein BCR42DRAFT_444420 [Absidia repens]